MNDVLIVIPARGGSVGVPHKCTRPLGDKSCVERVVATALQTDADVLVTTDDATVKDLVCGSPVSIHHEPVRKGEAPLDGCIAEAVAWLEFQQGRSFDIIVTMQANCPFTKKWTLEAAVIAARMHETAIVVRDDRGLRWHTKAEQPVLSASAPPRMVRQQMPPEWREVGAVFATQRKYVTPESRMGHTVYLIPVTGPEALDIDTEADWLLAECYAARGDLVGIS